MANTILNETILEGRGAKEVFESILSEFETSYEIPIDRLDDEPLIRSVGKRWPLEIVQLTEDKVSFVFYTRWVGIYGHIYRWAKKFRAVRFTYRFTDTTYWQPMGGATWNDLKMYANAGELLNEHQIRLDEYLIPQFEGSGDATCKQCRYEFGLYQCDIRTEESSFRCPRCGYEDFYTQLTDEEGHRYGRRYDALDGCGAAWVTPLGRLSSSLKPLHSQKDVDDAVVQMRERIAKGELDGESSYVTRWDSQAKRIEVVAGKWCEKEEVEPTSSF